MLAGVMETLQSAKASSRVTFGLFEADLKSGELWKAGYRVKLQALPFKVLTILLENAGEIVTREELQNRVWGPNVNVDFEHSLSNAIKKLREALGDSADNPRFVETLSRRGVRFIAPVGLVEPKFSTATVVTTKISQDFANTKTAPSTENIRASATMLRVPVSNRYLIAGLLITLSILLAVCTIQFLNSRKPVAELPRLSQITQDGSVYASKDHLLGAISAFASDGAHLFTPTTENGEVLLSRISVSSGSGQTIPVLSQIGSPEVQDISPDGSRLLLKSNLASAVQQPLWIVSTDGGSAFRVPNVLAQAATWMPNGKSILYASGEQLAVVSLDDGKSTVLATVPGRAFWPRWSPDGRVLRFTIIDSVNHTSSLWEMKANEHTAHPILKALNDSVRQCCGVWTADGKWFIFEATKDGNTDLWKVDSSLNLGPIRITNGPLNYKAPAPAHEGEQIFFVGQEVHSMLERFDIQRQEYVSQAGFLSTADHIVYSADGKWVIWTDPGHRLWRARMDGSDKVLLTSSSMWVYMAAWSADSTHIAFMAREPRQPWQIYMINADGGPPEHLLKEDQNIGDPSFSEDGKYLVFGTVPELIGAGDGNKSLSIMELESRKVSPLPGSKGVYSPRWSPDGRFIAAITLDQKEIRLYDTKAAKWKTLAATSAALPVWSKDSHFLYVHAYRSPNRPILRISVPDGRIEEVADLKNFHSGNITHADFAGITPDGVPLMHAEVSSGNLYSMDLRQK